VNESYKDRSGNDQENVHFVDAQVWRSLAEACGELKKGAPVLIAGRFVTDSWDDKDGNKRYQNRIEASRVEFLTRGNGQTQQPADSNRPAPPSPSRKLDIDEEFPPEDDLPF
jgi:single-strand DNA-binding protein